MRIKLTLEYDGAGYSGWQKQASGVATIQEVIETSISTYLNSCAKKAGVDVQPAPELKASGRTDAGVSAKGQVAHFDWPKEVPVDIARLAYSLDGICPAAVHVRSAEAVGEEFDARLSPHIKCYRYHIKLRRSGSGLDREYWWPQPRSLDISAMIEAASLFSGQHDFSSFRAQDCTAKTTLRTVHLSELTRVSSEDLYFSVLGKGFLKQMVRIMTGTLIEVGVGKRKPTDILEILEKCERSAAGQTAPATGLCLEWVKYL